MALKTIRCPVCGSNGIHKQSDGTYKCENCDALFYEESMRANEQALMNAVGELLYGKEQERIAAIRQSLWKLVHAEFIDGVKITQLCRELQTVLPNDFLAQFYELACSGSYKPLVDFLNALDVTAYYDYVDEILALCIKLLRPETLFAVNNLISRAYETRDVILYNKWNETLAPKAQAVEDGIYDVTLSRDVFVAYKSEDIAKVDELVSYLENEEGLTCFVAVRNLMHGKMLDYESMLATAMKNCSVLVFVSSKQSRRTGDARNIELKNLRDEELDNGPPEYKARNDYKGLPKTYKKPRVEYVIEEYVNTAAEKFVAEFFSGYERQYKIKDVAERIFEQLDTKVFDGKDVEFNAGVEHYKSKRYELALVEFSAAAEKGHVEASRYLGDMYYYGHGVPQSYADALAHYERAAALGSSIAKVRADAARKAEADRIVKEEKNREKERREREKQEKAQRRLEQKTSRRNKRAGADVDSILKIAAAICTLLGAAGGLFAYIFPYHYILMTENYREIWLTLTIIAIVINAAGVAVFMALLVRKNESIGLYAFSMVFIAGFCLLMGGVTDSMYGWGIACIVLCGICAVVVAIIAVACRENISLATVFCYLFMCIAFCGIGYGYMCQQQIDGKTENGQFYYTVLEDNTIAVMVEDYECGELFIPESIDDMRVTRIMRPKYKKHNDKLTAVRIPETVLYIDSGVFEGCSALAEVTMPDGLLAVGERAFYGCSTLKKVIFGEELKTIGKSAFENCIALGRIEIFGNVEAVGDSAFRGCSALESIKLGEGVKQINDHAFRNCSKLNKVELPTTLVSIDDHAFENCIALKTIYIPQGVDNISSDSFKGCASLTFYCELDSKPGMFNKKSYYGVDGHDVKWGVTRGQYLEIIMQN